MPALEAKAVGGHPDIYSSRTLRATQKFCLEEGKKDPVSQLPHAGFYYVKGLTNKLGKDKHPLGKTKPQTINKMSIIYNECIIKLGKGRQVEGLDSA